MADSLEFGHPVSAAADEDHRATERNDLPKSTTRIDPESSGESGDAAGNGTADELLEESVAARVIAFLQERGRLGNPDLARARR